MPSEQLQNITSAMWANAEEEVEQLRAEIERLRAALAAARDALRNGFEPDNQSRAYKAADAALRETE